MGALALYGRCLWGDFEVILVAVWGQFAVFMDDFVSLDGHFAMNVESLWVY